MRFSMSFGRGDPAAPASPDSPSPGATALAPAEMAAAELRLLEAQLERMRGMLFGYSSLFFATIRNWAFLCIGLLVLGWSGVLPAAVVPVPFIVPFAFLETGYLFWYTIFARRHAERLEQAINERLGRDVLLAHRLEAAYFYPPDAPKIAALSFGNPLGFMGGMTVGYTVGAALLWTAGLVSTATYLDGLTPGPSGPDLLALVVPGAIAWTLAIAGYLVWAFLRRADEDRLLAALEAAYGPAAQPASAPEPAHEPAPEPVLEPAAEPAATGRRSEPTATDVSDAPATGVTPDPAPKEPTP
jgi:hypothetical protein